MSKPNQDNAPGKAQNPNRPPLPDPGKNPDFPEDEPIGSGGGDPPPTQPR
jgi:hypothetical protein